MTADRRRYSLYRLHLAHRYYADGGTAGTRYPVAAGTPGTLHPAGSPVEARTWATYCDAHRRAESIRDAYRSTGRGAPFPTAPRTPHTV